MDLALSFDTSYSKREQLLWIGILSKQLGKLEAHQTCDIQLEIVPLACGLKVRFKQTTKKKDYNLFCFFFSVLVV